ncbi:MAG TPA: PEP-CTERM sorting domain-containing protein [Pirellulales bacterium]|jgi:T5SS/PEP-CTERM-associated repeat protein
MNPHCDRRKCRHRLALTYRLPWKRMTLAIAIAILAVTEIASAVERDWLPGSGNWSDSTHWLPSGVPAALDDAVIQLSDDVAETVTYDYTGPDLKLNSLSFSDVTGVSDSAFLMSANNLSAQTQYIGISNPVLGQLSAVGKFVQTGGINTVGDLFLGYNPLDSGTYQLGGTGALAAGSETIGFGGTGTFQQTGGSNTLTTDLRIGSVGGATGSYSLGGGALQAGGNVTVGNALGGHGTLSISGTGTLKVSGALTVSALGSASQSGGAVTVTGANGVTINSTGGGSGGYSLSGGTLSVSSLKLAASAGTTGSLAISGGSVSVGNNFEYVGFNGTGTVNHSGGTNTAGFGLLLGSGNGSLGTYNLSGAGALGVNNGIEVVGYFHGTGVFNQTGGTNSGISSFDLGQSNGGNGTYNLSGGTATVSGNVDVGGSGLAAGGTGVLNVSGAGALSVGAALTAYNTTGSKINFTGGSISTAALNFNGTPALLNWTGGTLNLTSSATFDPAAAASSTSAALGAALTLGSNSVVKNQTLAISGNETLGGASAFHLTINSGGAHAVTGALSVNAGTLAENGGTIAIGGSGAAPATPGLILGNGAAGTLNVNSGGQLTAANNVVVGSGTSAGTLNVTCGQATLASQLILASGAGSTGQATISGASATLSADQGVFVGKDGDGTLNINQGATVTAAFCLIAPLLGSTAHTTIGGNGTKLQTVDGLYVGNSGNAMLNVDSGGQISCGFFSVGGNSDGVGQADIDGANSSLAVQTVPAGQNQPSLAVGQFGSGSLSLSNGAIATAAIIEIGEFHGSAGQATVSSGGSLQGGNFLSVGTAYNPTGGNFLDLGPNGGTGALTVNALATATVGNQLRLGDGGTVDVSSGGVVIVGNTLGVIGSGTVFVADGGVLKGTGLVKGNLANIGGTVQPGFSPGVLHVSGEYQQTGGTLGIEIGGSATVVLGDGSVHLPYDQLSVGGNFHAGGTLAVSLINNFLPKAGEQFKILDWGSTGGTMSGAFDTLTLPTDGGRIAWDSSQLYTNGNLNVADTYYAGDFNRDGVVTLADFDSMMAALVNIPGYRSGIGAGLTDAEFLLIADINHDYDPATQTGGFNNGDLQGMLALLAANPAPIPVATGQPLSVPEPASIVLMIVGAVGGALCRRQRIGRSFAKLRMAGVD